MPKDANGRFGLVSALISLFAFLTAAVEPGCLIFAAWFWLIAYGFHDVRRDQQRAENSRRLAQAAEATYARLASTQPRQ